jgi:hypothetical protein
MNSSKQHAVYIEVSAGVRYWEDATVNGVEDNDGGLIPFKRGSLWCPVIRLADGIVMDWPAGTEADIHYKVCDAGEYWLLDADRQRVAKWGGFYVPSAFLCHGDKGYGDYIIFKVGADGAIQKWEQPAIEWAKEDEDAGWKQLRLHGATTDEKVAEDRRAVLQLLYEAHHREPCGPTLEAISAAIQHLQAVDPQ